ncbi:mCG1047119, partial [Mus musculus]
TLLLSLPSTSFREINLLLYPSNLPCWGAGGKRLLQKRPFSIERHSWVCLRILVSLHDERHDFLFYFPQHLERNQSSSLKLRMKPPLPGALQTVGRNCCGCLPSPGPSLSLLQDLLTVEASSPLLVTAHSLWKRPVFMSYTLRKVRDSAHVPRNCKLLTAGMGVILEEHALASA